jgi:hypothetical protein
VQVRAARTLPPPALPCPDLSRVVCCLGSVCMGCRLRARVCAVLCCAALLPPSTLVCIALRSLLVFCPPQATFEKRATFQLPDCAKHFLDQVVAMSDDDWIPTEDDVLRARVRTTGIVKKDFLIEGNKFQMYDVGGQVTAGAEMGGEERLRVPRGAGGYGAPFGCWWFR